MAGHTFIGKQRLCYTEVSDFTDYQGIGHDPMYKRYDSVFSVVKRAIPADLQHFLATPEYLNDEDQICWHVANWNERPTRLTDLTGAEYDKYKAILEDTVRAYKSSVINLSGEDLQIMAGAIKYVDDDRVYCSDDKVYLVAWGMSLDVRQHKVIGSVIHDFEYVKKFKVTFDAGEHGSLPKFDQSMNKAEGSTLSNEDLPTVDAEEGWDFVGWSPSPEGLVITSDLNFTAQYCEQTEEPITPVLPVVEEPDPELFYNCRFDAGEHGKIEGVSNVRKAANTTLVAGEIPGVTANKGYKFKGWDISPFNLLVNEDKVFTAQYDEIIPWYRRWWLWLTGKGCLKWLLWILLAILLCWLLSWLLRGCVGCTGHHEPINGVVPIDTISGPGGKTVDDNGFVHPVTDEEGNLPDEESIVSPVMGEGGTEPPIIEQPGMPNIFANRLFLFLENENDDIEALARDFKKTYPGDQYSIIGYDKEVKLLVIQVPEAERDEIRRTINSRIPNHDFIVFDEEVYEINGSVSESTEDIGWHLDAIHLKQGWNYTQGDANVKIAIVDDGIQPGHPMFKGRIVEAYNVFTQNNSLSVGDGHGTHTAGIAAGSSEFYAKGASGIAPGCKIMPIQVFDNRMCPLSALVAGVMYALHHDADVVNISIGPSFQGLNVLPVQQQEEISKTQFHNVAALWTRVCKLAARKKCILVFAAGNDDILTSIPPENRNESSIVVTAVDKRMYPTTFTNYGPCSDISAPGKSIYSSFPTNAFRSFDGTSMAAPIVSGTIALMKSLKKDLTVVEARNALFSTGADVYGWIPPMVLVDKVLDATKRGDFSRREREARSVPDDVDVHLGSGRIPVDDVDVDLGFGRIPVVDDVDVHPGSGTIPVDNDGEVVITRPDPVQVVRPIPEDETDYDAIRRQIAEYKRKIKDLEKLLPKK